LASATQGLSNMPICMDFESDLPSIGLTSSPSEAKGSLTYSFVLEHSDETVSDKL
jgi:hypothetical protein